MRRPTSASSRHLAALDGVRGIAILVVLIHNTGFILSGSDLFLLKLTSWTAAAGWTGVQLFFVLSGFLITGILVDSLGPEGYFRTFYARRTLRIFPLYYAFLAVTVFVVPLFADPAWTEGAQRNQWWYWTYTSNWSSPFGHSIPGLSHFWSLAVEEQFYLLWPLLVFLLKRRHLLALCVAIIIVTPFVRLLLPQAGLPLLTGYEWTIARWDALAFGALLALLLRLEPRPAWLPRTMGYVAGSGIALLLVFVAVVRGFHEGDLRVQVAGQTLIAALSAALIYFSVVPPAGVAGSIPRVVSAGWLRFLGKYSYAIYVFHFPIHILLSPRLAGWVNGADTLSRLPRLALYIAAVSALSIVAAMISWRVLEKPFLDLKDRLAPRPFAETP